MSQIESVACDDRIKNILHYHYMVMGCSLRKSRKAKGPYAQGLIEFMAKKHGFVRKYVLLFCYSMVTTSDSKFNPAKVNTNGFSTNGAGRKIIHLKFGKMSRGSSNIT